MSRIDDLAPDRRAVLQLLLKQGKTYDELATMLRIEPEAVRERATAALDELGPRDGAPLPESRKAEITDYLLGQQSASRRQSTREFLETSPPGRGWARVVAGELRPLAGDSLPDVPAEGTEVEEAFGALEARERRRAEVQRSSKAGGAILIIGAVIVAVALIFVIRAISDGDDDESASSNGGSTQTQQTSTTNGGGGEPEVVNQINLRPPEGSTSDALGALFILRQEGELAIAVQAQGLQPTTRERFYAAWLTGEGRRPRALGFTPAVSGRGQAKGRLQFASGLPEGADRYQTFLITSESTGRPSEPGAAVLQGPLDLSP
jgi:hypothetical protein